MTSRRNTRSQRAGSTLALRLAAALLCALAFSGCNAGLVALGLAAGLSSDSGGGSRTRRSAGFEVSLRGVEDARLAPAAVRVNFRLVNSRSRSGQVVFEFAPDGGSFARMSLEAPSSGRVESRGLLVEIPTSPAGQDHSLRWNAAADLGTDALRSGRLRLTASNAVEQAVVVGNDAPEVRDAAFQQDGSGVVRISVTLADSSSDPVEIAVEYSPSLAGAGAAFRAASLDGPLGPLASSPSGQAHEVRWHSSVDLGQIDRDVQLRFVPQDVVLGRPGKTGATFRTDLFLDNNQPPRAVLFGPSQTESDDSRRGQALRFAVEDPDGDPVDVILQWTLDSEDFPELPPEIDGDPERRAALLRDPAEADSRRTLRIATLDPQGIEGPVEAPALGLQLAADEVLASWILNDAELRGLTLLPSDPGAETTTPAIAGRLVELLAPSGAVVQTRRICAFEPEAGILRLDLPFEPAASTLQRLRIHLGGPAVLSTAGGLVEHHLVWQSAADLPGGGAVRFRVVPFDRSAAIDPELAATCGRTESFPSENAVLGSRGEAAAPEEEKLLHGPFARAPLPIVDLGPDDLPAALAVADLDGDSRSDIALVDSSSGSLVLLQQTVPLGFDALRLFDSRMRAPSGVAVADLDADGRLDVAVTIPEFTTAADPEIGIPAFERPGSVLLFLQRRPDNFISDRVQLTAGGVLVRPSGILARDLDGDGDVDLVVGEDSPFSFTLTLYFFFRGSAPAGFACSEQDSGYTFCPVSLGLLGRIQDLGFADVDSDGRDDIVVTYSRGFSVLFGNDAAFAAAERLDVLIPTGQDAVTVAFADAVPGGLLDAAVATAAGILRRVEILEQFQPRQFRTAATPLSLRFLLPADLVSLDLDQSGSIDLVAAHQAGGSLLPGPALCLADSGGNFSCEVLDTAPEPGSADVVALAAGDIDGDGSVDLVSGQTAAAGGPSVVVYFQRPPGSFAAAAEGIAAFPSGFAPTDLTAADLDSDGRVDFAALSPSEGTLTVLRQLPSGAFEARNAAISQSAGAVGPFALAAADLDGDGDVDLVTANADSNSLSVLYQGAESLSFPSGVATLLAAGLRGPESVAAADLDGDGRLDIVTAGRGSDNVLLFRQLPGRDFAPAEVLAAPGMPGVILAEPIAVLVRDLNGDSRPEVVVAGHTSGNVLVLVQEPSRDRFRPLSIDLGRAALPVGLAAANLDGDGALDLAAASLGEPALAAILQDPLEPLSFAVQPLPIGPAAPTSLAAADFNRDGIPDLAVSSATPGAASVEVLLGSRPPGGFAAMAHRSLSERDLEAPVKTLPVDADADGEIDLAVLDRAGDAVLLFRGGK